MAGEYQSDKKDMSNRSARIIETVETVSLRAQIPRTSLKRGNKIRPLLFLLLFGCLAAAPINAADTLRWETNKVSADIRSTELTAVLEKVAAVTGWHVFVEPETLHTVSTKFSNLPPGEALHKLLGDVNFFLMPDAKQPKLYVFRTRMQNATRMVHPAPIAAKESKSKVIPNELIVRLKPGAKIEDIAKLLGAKVIGQIDGINAYRLKFDDQSAADGARDQLSSNSDVASVENNYLFNAPEMVQPSSMSAPPLQLNVNPPTGNGRVIVGLIDTAVQSLGPELDRFLSPQISLAGEAQLDSNTPLHGTAMAETMLRTFQLLGNGSTSVTIQRYDIYGPNEAADTFTLAKALAEAINAGANPISLSLGSRTDSQIVRDIISQGNDKGVNFFAAVGNDAGPQMDFPAGDPGATPVTALERNGQNASYANNSKDSAVGAMGTVIVPFGGQSFSVSGTSPATAIVAATAANLMETSHITASEANSRLLSSPTRTTIPGK